MFRRCIPEIIPATARKGIGLVKKGADNVLLQDPQAPLHQTQQEHRAISSSLLDEAELGGIVNMLLLPP